MDLSVVMDMLLRKRCSRGDFGQRRTRQRIVDAILGAETLEERNRLLEEVAVRCRRAWVGKAPEQALLLKEHSNALFTLLADRILDEGRLDLFLASTYTSHLLVARDGVDSMAMLTRPGAYTELEFRYFGRMLFEVVFFRHIGSTLDRSLTFALALLERLDAVWQSIVDDPVLQQREEGWTKKFEERLGMPSYELIRLYERDPRAFKRLILDAGFTSDDAGPELSLDQNPPVWELVAAQKLLLLCATMPSHTQTPAKFWIERIVEAAAGGHAGADDVLRALAHMFTMIRGDSRFAVIEQDDAGPLSAQALFDGLVDGLVPQRHSTPVLILRKEHKRMLVEWGTRERQRNEEHLSQAIDQVRWFQAHRGEVLRATQRRMEEIRTRPRRALLPGGRDHVEIQSVALRQVGIRAVAFHAEGYEFPDAGLDIFTRFTTPHLIRRRVSLLQIDTFSDDVLVSGKGRFNYPAEVREMLRAVVIDVLHRIVVGDRELRERRHPSRVVRNGDAPMIDLAPIIRKRRAHLRRLPAGQQAGPKARAHASELRWKLPPGVTFVRAYYEEEQIVYDLPTEPTAVYTDDDFFDLGGEA